MEIHLDLHLDGVEIGSFHGTKGDIKRDGGRLTLFRNGNIVKDFYLKDLDENLYIDELKQYEAFYESLFKKIDLQKKSLQVWLLMEACNVSSKQNREVLIDEIIEDIDLNYL